MTYDVRNVRCKLIHNYEIHEVARVSIKLAILLCLSLDNIFKTQLSASQHSMPRFQVALGEQSTSRSSADSSPRPAIRWFGQKLWILVTISCSACLRKGGWRKAIPREVAIGPLGMISRVVQIRPDLTAASTTMLVTLSETLSELHGTIRKALSLQASYPTLRNSQQG
jgi:hypothetical protein